MQLKDNKVTMRMPTFSYVECIHVSINDLMSQNVYPKIQILKLWMNKDLIII